MVEREIKYLIKFCSKEEYADDLVAGKLFMNAAGYYHHLEEGQGDRMEGALSSRLMMFKGTNRPVYCMYAVFADEVENGKIRLPRELLDDFHCERGWAVLINFSAFNDELANLDTGGYALTGGLVLYGGISDESTVFLLQCQDDRQLFVKHPKFKHQQEFRIVVYSSLKQITHKEVRDGIEVDVIDAYKPYEPAVYNFPNSLDGIARKVSMADLKMLEDGSRLMNINN